MTRKMPANEHSAGRLDNIKRFIKCHDSEPKCAAYVGFTDLGQFRKFQFSYIVLEVFKLWEKYCMQGKSSNIPLQLIKDLQNPNEVFPEDLSDAVKRYGPNAVLMNPNAKESLQQRERDNNLSYLKATLIYRLTNRIERVLPIDDGDGLKARQATATEDFREATNLSILAYDPTTITMPELGPHTHLGELSLEKYNRVMTVLRSIGHTMSGERWVQKLGAEDPFGAYRLHPSSWPRWMIQEKKPTDTAPKVPSFPSKHIHLVHKSEQKTKHSVALQAHIEEHVEPEGLYMPEIKQFPSKDPRHFESGEQWRDTLRRQLNMQKLRIEFFTMHLESSEGEGEAISVKKIPVYGPAQSVPWSEVNKILLQTNLEVQFAYTVRPLAEGEDYEPEYHGVPRSLEADLRVGVDKDIERIEPLPSVDPADEAEEIENMAFLSGGGAAQKRRAPAKWTRP